MVELLKWSGAVPVGDLNVVNRADVLVFLGIFE
jgi:hypothetical protein